MMKTLEKGRKTWKVSVNLSSSQEVNCTGGGGRGGNSNVKMSGMLVRKFELNPLGVAGGLCHS